jgi:hypothetical protein
MVGIIRNQDVYASEMGLVPPAEPARKLTPDNKPLPVEAVLADLPWRCVTWRWARGAVARRSG